VRVAHRFSNALEHPVASAQHIIVPESQDAIPVGAEERIAKRISFQSIRVLAAVALDHQPGR